VTKNLVFVHDGPLSYSPDGTYYGYGYRGCYERYSQLGDSITFVIRTKASTDKGRYDALPTAIKVISFPNFMSPRLYLRRYKAKKIILNAVKDADVLVLRNSSAAHIAEKYARKHNIPYIFESVGCSWDSLTHHSLLGALIAPKAFLKQRQVVRRAPFVHYVTNEFLQHRYPTKGISIGCSDVVMNPAPQEVLESRLKRVSLKQANCHVVLGTAAAIDVRYKGQDTIIRAIPMLLKQGYDIEYHLAGGNAKGSTFLVDLARRLGVIDRVHFFGSLSSSEMPNFYDSLDVYVQPSKQEGLPRSVIEAMGRGCPVIGSNAGGIPELISTDFVFHKGSQRGFCRVFNRLLSSDLSEISRRNYEKSKEYRPEVLKERIEEFYNTFIEMSGNQ